MNKKQFFTLLYILLIVSVIAFMVWCVFWLRTESLSCLRDPIQYFANKSGSFCYCSDEVNWVTG